MAKIIGLATIVSTDGLYGTPVSIGAVVEVLDSTDLLRTSTSVVVLVPGSIGPFAGGWGVSKYSLRYLHDSRVLRLLYGLPE